MAGSKTKWKFAHAVQELAMEKSLKKVTVNDIVEKSNMTRQAFYYHFHDIYELLEWTCTKQLFGPCFHQSAGEWFIGLTERLKNNQKFYRKVIEFDSSLLEKLLKEQVEKQIENVFMTKEEPSGRRKNGEDGIFLKEFLSMSCANYLEEWICDCKCEKQEDMAQKLISLVVYIRNGYEIVEHKPLRVFA